ncbi:MATH and LRR domain-containing protein PFE0570w-like isoform X3 [Apis cerana]|nr:MATH and LRR domain-containing protein PFE0570w-like isoform X3 [Apis cerana]
MLLNESLIIFHNVNTEKNESILSHDSQLKNNNHISKNIIVYEDSNKKLIEQSDQISDYLESNIYNFDNNKLNITSDQNICMDLTEVVSPVANSINHDETKMFKNASIELINDILPTINKKNFQQFNKSNVEESSITNQNKSMEITMPQPSILKLNKNIDNIDINTFCVDDKTKRLDISMEITSTIPTSLCNLQPNNNDINYYVSNLISYNNDNKKTPFHDISMSTTKAVETIVHKLSDRSSMVQKISQYNITKQDEETKLLNTSITEITEAVPINVHSVIKNYGPNAINFDTEINVKKSKYDSNIYETLTNYDRTKFYNNEEMEFTTAITSLPAICQNNLQLSMQDISCMQLNSSNSISDNSGNHPLTNKTIIFDNNSMTVTKIVPTLDRKNQDIITILSQSEIDFDICSNKFRQSILSDNFEKKNLIDISNNKDNLLRDNSTIIKIPSLLNSDIISNDNNDSKMKFTKAVTSISTIDQNNLQIPQDILCTQSNSVNPISDNCKNHLLLNKTIIFDDNSMIITKIIPILDRKHQDTFFQTDNTCSETDNTCSIKNRQSILSSNIKKRDLMNILSKDNIRDSIVTIPSSSSSDIISNNNEKMELTTAIISSSALHQNNLQIPIQNISCTQPNSSNLISDNCKNHSLSKTNKTIIFDDNSMIITKVVPIFDKKQQDIMTTDSQEINSDICSAKVRQSVLHNNIEKSNFTNFSINIDSEVLKNNSVKSTKHINSCLLNTNIENNTIRSSTPIKVQDFVNIKPSMSSHESMQQQTFASALKENNTEIVCANISNCISNKSFSAINLELNKNEHILKYPQTFISHPRRTYTIHSSNSNHTFTVNNKKENNISEINNDVSYELNNEENNACSILNNTKDLENKEDYDIKYLMNGKDIFLNESLEILESIKPPSFDCLDDLSHIDHSINIICNKKIDIETNCLSQNENNESENILKFKDYQKNVQIENQHKSQTFVIKHAFLSDPLENSNENKIQTNEISKLELLTQKDTDIDTNSRILEFSSSTINNSENFCNLMHNTDEDFQKLHMNNSNLECVLSKATYKTLKADDSNKLNDTHMMEFYSNEKFQSNLKSHTFCIEEENVIIKSFSFLMNELKICAKSNEIIWEVYYENIERNMFIIGFISCSLLVIIFTQNPCEKTNDRYIKKINIISQLADDADALITIVHRIILEKLDIKKLLDLYKNREDILPMLEYISKEVKLAMDFMFDLKRLNDPNLMEITHDSISFISQTKTGNIILKITINIKPFDKIEFQNISVHCLIGSVREEDVKKLIINVKKDHKFLRRYINDVKDYIYLMEKSGNMI